MSFFTVVIPYFNRESFLPRTLDSIAAQTFRPVELILVNNTSTDASERICREFAQKYDRPDFHVILASNNTPGAAHARNTGLRLAKGKWISFFDSDDEMSPAFLQKMQEALERDRCDIVATATKMIFPDGKEKVRTVCYTTSVADQILTAMLSTQSMTMRTEFVRKIGGWNEELSTWDDWEFGIRILLAQPKLTWIRDEVFHRIYQHGESLTGISFTSTYERIRVAFAAVDRLLAVHACADASAVEALWMRKAIFAGHLAKEGSERYSRQVLSEINWGIERKCLRTVCQWLFLYTKFGGKGGWRFFKIWERLPWR